MAICKVWILVITLLLAVLGGLLWQSFEPTTHIAPNGKSIKSYSLNAVTWEALTSHWKGNSTGRLDLYYKLASEDSLVNKTVIITGGSKGLGKGIAARLYSLGADIIELSRSGSEERNQALKDEGMKLSPLAHAVADGHKPVVKNYKIDLTDLTAIEEVVKAMAKDGVKSNIVILNAGLAPKKSSNTPQGFEVALATNCFGNFALANLLIQYGIVERNTTPASRIIGVTSETHRCPPPLDLSSLTDNVTYGMKEGMEFYARSKLCLTTLLHQLANHLGPQGICVHSICPGAVSTEIAQGLPFGLQHIVDLMMYAFQTPTKAAGPVIELAVSPYLEDETDLYYFMDNQVSPRTDARDNETGSALWDLVVKLVQPHLSIDIGGGSH